MHSDYSQLLCPEFVMLEMTIVHFIVVVSHSACLFVCVFVYRARMDELRIFLEVEAWEVCPVRSSFTIHKLRVCTHVVGA